MAIMVHRCTYSLDESTTTRIRTLAARWSVSQAEVIRRAVAQADMPADKPDAVTLLRQLHESGNGLNEADAQRYLAQIRSDRKEWRST